MTRLTFALLAFLVIGATPSKPADVPPAPAEPTPATAPPQDAQSVKECMVCGDQLKKALKPCEARSGAARETCRADARAKADHCAEGRVGNCNLDLIMDPPGDAGVTN